MEINALTGEPHLSTHDAASREGEDWPLRCASVSGMPCRLSLNAVACQRESNCGLRDNEPVFAITQRSVII